MARHRTEVGKSADRQLYLLKRWAGAPEYSPLSAVPEDELSDLYYSDPDGLWYKEFATGQQSWPSFQLELGRAAGQLSQDSATWNYAIGHPIEGGTVVGAMSGGAAVSGAGGIALGSAFNPTPAIAGLVNAYGWGQTGQSYLQYRATGNTTARNNAGFDMGVNTASFIGSTRQNAALLLLGSAIFVFGLLQAAHAPFQRWRIGFIVDNPQPIFWSTI